MVYHIGVCDDDRETCAELEEIVYQYGKNKGIDIDVSVWYAGESLCNFLKQDNILDILFLDIELISGNAFRIFVETLSNESGRTIIIKKHSIIRKKEPDF